MSNQSDYDDDDESGIDSVSSGNSFGTVDYPSSSDDDDDSNDGQSVVHTMVNERSTPRRVDFILWNRRARTNAAIQSARAQPENAIYSSPAQPNPAIYSSPEQSNAALQNDVTLVCDEEDTGYSSSGSSGEDTAATDPMHDQAAQREMRDTLTCPITGARLRDPVITPSGVTYSRAALARWLRTSRTDPSTRQPLAMAQVVPNRAVAALVKTLSKRKRRRADGCVEQAARLAQVTTRPSA